MDIPYACARCESLFGPQRHSLKIWDGKRYCVECINAVSPELLAWAREHAYLEETLPLEAISRKKSYKYNYLYPMIGTCVLIFLAISLISGEIWWSFVISLFPVGMIMPIFLLDLKFDFAGSKAARELPRTLVIQNNQLIVVHEEESQFFELSELYYYESDTDRTVDNLYLENRPALILEKKPGWNWQRFVWEEIRYACGLTPEKRELWVSFFELVDLPRKEMMSTRRYHFITFLLVMTFLLASCAIFFQSPPVGFALLALMTWIFPLQLLNTSKENFTTVVAVAAALFLNTFVFYAFISRNLGHAGLYCLVQICLFAAAVFYIRKLISASNQKT